jgi:hypothetical protein
VDYSVLIVHPPSPTINFSLNFRRNDKLKPSAKAGILPK